MRHPRVVRAYHGTTFSTAVDIFHHRKPIQLSDKPGNWLGVGAYFFEENLTKAVDWALVQVGLRARLGAFHSPAVLEADLDLTDCLDLCSSESHQILAAIAGKLQLAGALAQQHGPELASFGGAGSSGKSFVIADYPMSAQFADDHYADKQVIDALVAELAREGRSVTSVRASFACGQQPYSNSHFFSDTHTQIAVIDTARVVKLIRMIHPIP
jgi:hypothetical protein